MRRTIALAAGLFALSGCATIDMMVDSFEPPPEMGFRMFPNEGVFRDQERFRGFPGDPVFARATNEVRRPDPGEGMSPMMRLRGIYQDERGQPRFTDCNTDRVYRVAGAISEDPDVEEPRAEARAALASAYAGARAEPGAPVQVSVDARLVLMNRGEGRGAERAVLVEKFVRVLPGAQCSLQG
jgi:hypothetical protein